MIKLRAVALGAACTVAILSGSAFAETKLAIGCTATTDCASAMVALDQGIFKKNGLDVSMTLIGLNSDIPAALVSDSIQIGGTTPPVFLQAVDGGLELVAIAGASSSTPATADTTSVLVPAGSTIKAPKDFIGKKIGVPGVGAFLHVLFSKWLIDGGVELKQVSFVEVSLPTMSDALKSGVVDAVVAPEPMQSRIVSNGTGIVADYFLRSLPERRPQIFYSASRSWADANPDALKAFRASIEEAAKIVNDNPDLGRKSVSGFTKIPMDVLATLKLTFSDPTLDAEQLDWWVKVMEQQAMLLGKPDTATLLQPK